jgi:uncharacterized repeat protein (TIGR01451 family)
MKFFTLLILLPISIIAIGGVTPVSANGTKSLYVNRDLNAGSPIRAYSIDPAPTYLTWQFDSVPTRYGGAGLAIDTDSAILFVTFEGSGTLDIVNAINLEKLGQVIAPGASNLAGIVMDQDNQKVYTVDRNTNKLYVYDWDAASTTLTLDKVINLPGIIPDGEHYEGAHGIALDEINDLLYVGDVTTDVKYYSTADWSLVGSFTVSQKVMGIAVDAVNNIVYTGNALDWTQYGSLHLLCKYDLDGTETTLDIRTLEGGLQYDNVVGLAVDQATGILYITTGNQASGGSDRILVFDSDLNLLHTTGNIGNPTGLVVPGKPITYDPLNLEKTDELSEDECVKIGDTITYTISYENTNPYDVTGVTITDDIPAETTFVSASDGGTFDGSTVKWDIGPLTSGTSGFVTLLVDVNTDAIPGSTIVNYCTINSEETGPSSEIEETDICPVIPVDIDIKPGSYPNSINLGSKGVVPVAILMTEDFDVSTVDPSTVEFAGAAPIRWTMEDVDGDGDMDLLFHFKTQELDLTKDSTEAILTGETYLGMPIEGIDTVKIVPSKKDN